MGNGVEVCEKCSYNTAKKDGGYGGRSVTVSRRLSLIGVPNGV